MGAVKDIYEIAKELIAGAKALGNTELAMQAIDMYSRLVDMKKDYEELEQKLKNYENAKEIEKRIERNNSDVAFYTDENGKKMAICTTCWDNNKKIVQVGFRDKYDHYDLYYCGVCNNKKYLNKE